MMLVLILDALTENLYLERSLTIFSKLFLKVTPPTNCCLRHVMHRIFVWPKYNHKWIKCVQLGILWPGSDAFSAFYPRINYDFAPWLYLVSKLLVHGCPSQMLHLGQMSSPRLLEPERKTLASRMRPPWDFAPWLYLVSKHLVNGCPSQMLHLGQMPNPRLLVYERKSIASKMSPPWDFAPWLYLVSKLLAHGCPSQMHHLGQMPSLRTLRTWEKKPSLSNESSMRFCSMTLFCVQASIQWMSIPNSHARPIFEFLWLKTHEKRPGLHNELYS